MVKKIFSAIVFSGLLVSTAQIFACGLGFWRNSVDIFLLEELLSEKNGSEEKVSPQKAESPIPKKSFGLLLEIEVSTRKKDILKIALKDCVVQ